MDEARLEELRTAVKELQELQQSQGWGRLVKVLKDNCRCRRENILRQNDPGLDGLIELAKDKQELAGIEFALAFPQFMINSYQEEFDTLLQEAQANEQDYE